MPRCIRRHRITPNPIPNQTTSRFAREAPRSCVNVLHTLVGNPTGYGTKAAHLPLPLVLVLTLPLTLTLALTLSLTLTLTLTLILTPTLTLALILTLTLTLIKAAASGALNLCISIFAMVWVTIWGAQLTSNLTVAKLAVGVAGLHELETAQLQLRTGPACSLGGAAYTGWLKTNYPSMELNEEATSISEMKVNPNPNLNPIPKPPPPPSSYRYPYP